MANIIEYFQENYEKREDAKVRVWALIPAIFVFNIGLALTHGEGPIFVAFFLFLLYSWFGVDFVAYKYKKRQNRKTEREVTQVARAEAFEDRLDKSFGLDIK